MLDSFIYEVNGKVFYYGRETKVFYEEREYNPTEGYTIVKFSCQVPSFGAVGPQNFEVIKDVATYLPISKTENYIAINVPVAVKTSENVHIGDEAGLYIAEPYDDADNIWVESDDAEALFLKLQKENCLEYAYVDVLGEFASAAAMVTYYNANNTTYDPTLYAVAKALKTGTTEYLYIKTDCHIATAEFYKLKAIDKGNQNPRLVETNHFESQTTSESLIKENATNWVVNAYYEQGITILDDIVYNLASGDDMNHIYWVKMLLPNGRAIYRSCVIISNVANFPTDDFATLPLTFTKAME